jgi:hypothetical protein
MADQSPPRLSRGHKKRQRIKASKARKAALLDESPVETIRTTKAIQDIDAELQRVQQELNAAKELKEKRAQLEGAHKELEEIQSSMLPVAFSGSPETIGPEDAVKASDGPFELPETSDNVHRKTAHSSKRKHDGAMAEAEASKKQRRTGAASRPSTSARPSTTSRPPATSCPPSASTRQTRTSRRTRVNHETPQYDLLDPGFREYIRKVNFNKGNDDEADFLPAVNENDHGARPDEM